jgi:pimeloyl-ACP methyl ester carboxylesterase
MVSGQGKLDYLRYALRTRRESTVIAPDLPGLGDSSEPTAVYEKRSIAKVIHQLITHLGFVHINLVGHDIGAMVAYAYAAIHPETVQRLVLAESLLPGFGLEDKMDVAKGGFWHWLEPKNRSGKYSSANAAGSTKTGIVLGDRINTACYLN